MNRQKHLGKHRYKIKWKVGAAPITPELFDTFDEEKNGAANCLVCIVINSSPMFGTKMGLGK